jgi:hypothetical protein
LRLRLCARAEEEEGANPSGPFHGLLNEDALRASGIFTVWTPAELLEQAEKVDEPRTLGFMPLLGGLDPAAGWQSLRLLEKAMPDLQAIQQAKRARA